MDKVVQPSQIYARALYPLGYGCALWIPEPNNQLPTEYIQEGVRIGDVGILRARGSFDFLFNVCCSANDPINTGYGVPDDFQMLQWNGLIRRTNDVFPPNNPVVSGGAETRNISIEASASLPGVPIGAGAGFSIKFNKDRGALVIPPNGANSVDCQSTRTFREYAKQHARSWYHFVHETLGMEVENGSIYFITGFDKTDCWDNATFNSDTKERSLELIVMTGGLAGGDGRIRLSDSSIHASFSRRRSPPNNQYQNQALFIRGFRISIRHPVATFLGRSSIDVMSTDGASWRDALGKKRPNHMTHRGHASSSDGSASPGAVSIVENSSSAHGSIDVEDELSDDSESWGSGSSNTSLEEDDLIPLSELYHPSKVINDHVLQSMSDVELVVTHDEDWISSLNSQELEMPDDTLLVQRFRDMYQIQVENGCAVFCRAETSAPSVGTQADPITISSSNPFTSDVTGGPIVSVTNQPRASIDSNSLNTTTHSGTKSVSYAEDVPQVPPIPRRRSLSILAYLPTSTMVYWILSFCLYTDLCPS
ncbi:hypothetical protein L218DRAFT_358200 [Marasmius fiardii PR-910]|nr:hypothetical protein L218DRAFT_358200 [Marasmius fiardii PR-910]